jgi:hypothetical protein
MRTRIERKFGDRYTLEDLWPGVHRILRRASSNPYPGLVNAANQVHNAYALRNIYGAHYSTWAESLSDTEVRNFARYVAALWGASRCPTCGTFVSRRQGEEQVSFSCGHTNSITAPNVSGPSADN